MWKIHQELLGKPSIHFRLTSPNHKINPFNEPTETYTTNPYDSSSLSDNYSSTSTILNVDTGGLAFFTEADHIGYVQKGMNLVNAEGDAEATVSDLSLISDADGSLIFSLHIPDPTVEGSPLFTTGNNTIRITTSPTNASVLDLVKVLQKQIILQQVIKQIHKNKHLIFELLKLKEFRLVLINQYLDYLNRLVLDPTTETRSRRIDYYDPLAQSFLVERDQYQDGIL